MENTFWNFSDLETTSNNLEWTDQVDTEGIVCPINSGHQRSGKRIGDLILLPPKQWVDVLWTWYSDCLISDDVYGVLKENKISGFEVRPVQFINKGNLTNKPKYWELVVVGWGGVGSEASGVKIVLDCPKCLHRSYSPPNRMDLFFDSIKWDGNDFFMVWPFPNFKFTSQKVFDLLLKEKFKGFQMIPFKDLDFCFDHNISPGRLSHCMPEKRAKELAESNNIIF